MLLLVTSPLVVMAALGLVRVWARRVRAEYRAPALVPYTYRYELVGCTAEAWKRIHAGAVPVPVAELVKIADPAQIRKAAADRERVAGIRASMAKIGCTTPLILRLDRQGGLCVEDGHHRIVAAGGLLDELPVRISVVDRIRGYRSPAADLLVLLLHR